MKLWNQAPSCIVYRYFDYYFICFTAKSLVTNYQLALKVPFYINTMHVMWNLYQTSKHIKSETLNINNELLVWNILFNRSDILELIKNILISLNTDNDFSLYGLLVSTITGMKKLLAAVFVQFCHCIHSTVYKGTKIFYWSNSRTYSLGKNVDTKRFHPINWHGYMHLRAVLVILQRSVLWLKVSFRNWTYPLS